MDLDPKQLKEFIGEEFLLLIEGQPALALVLCEVEALPPPPEDALAQFPNMRRQPFSLLFEMPEASMGGEPAALRRSEPTNSASDRGRRATSPSRSS